VSKQGALEGRNLAGIVKRRERTDANRSGVCDAVCTDECWGYGDDEGMDQSSLQKGVDDAGTAFYHEGLDSEVAEFEEDLGERKHYGGIREGVRGEEKSILV